MPITSSSDPNSFVDYTDFPNNVVMKLRDLISPATGVPDDAVFMRPLRPVDPSVCAGIAATSWAPVDYEIGNRLPVISRYDYVVQGMIKHADEQMGLAAHALLSKRIRRMLDNALAGSLSLGTLQVTSSDDGATERALRWGVQRQQFLSPDIPGTFLYVSALEFYLETETVAI